jgi:hypothetical protein
MAGDDMATIKIILGTTWRSAGLGLLAGTLGGTSYGVLFANILLAFGIMSQAPFEVKPQDLVGALAAFVIFALIGSVMGGLFGVPSGLVVGVTAGLLLGVLTRVFFYPLTNARRYRRVIAGTSAAFTGLLAWFCFFSIMLFYANKSAANFGVLAAIGVVPALIASIGAGLMSRVIANWYESESIKGAFHHDGSN